MDDLEGGSYDDDEDIDDELDDELEEFEEEDRNDKMDDYLAQEAYENEGIMDPDMDEEDDDS
jgi:uncharacterized membrane protein